VRKGADGIQKKRSRRGKRMTENKEETAKVTHNFGSDFLTSDRLRRQKKKENTGTHIHIHAHTETRKQERERA
jgi:hypothetical protein